MTSQEFLKRYAVGERRKLERNRYATRKAAGFCVKCPNVAAPGAAACETCLAKYRAYAADRKGYLAALSVCYRCGRCPVTNYRMCLSCRVDDAERKRRKREIKRRNLQTAY